MTASSGAGFLAAFAVAVVSSMSGRPVAAEVATPETPPVAAQATAADGSDGTGDVEGKLPSLLVGAVRSDAPIEITSDELEMLQRESERQLIFRRNVRVIQADMVLLSERLDAFYPEGASQPERLIAAGKVEFKQGDRQAQCDKAVYQRAAELIVCTGNAELTQGCDRVRGQEIRFDLRSENVRVLGSPSVLIFPEGAAPDRGCGEGRP